MAKSLRCRVSGRVQGVAFRVWTRHLAQVNNARGYVRNLADGSVEVVLQGEEADLARIVQDLNDGPPLALVHRVDTQWVDEPEYPDFTIRREMSNTARSNP